MTVPTLYLDTSVFGAVVDDTLPDRIAATEVLFGLIRTGRYEAATSAVALREIAAAPPAIRQRILTNLDMAAGRVWLETAESQRIAAELLSSGIVPARFEDDARHLGVAIENGVWAVVSWNYRHMVNPHRRRKIAAACVLLDYPAPEVLSPPEVMGDEPT